MYATDLTQLQNSKPTIKNICLFVCATSLLLSLEFSSSSLGFKELWQILFLKLKGQALSSDLLTAENILINVRLPRIILASVCGAALGIAGVLSQGLFRNPLASPSLTGSASGATLGAVICFYLGFATTHTLSLPLFAIVGAFLSAAVLFILYTKDRKLDLSKLLLIGLTFSTMTGAFCSLIISLESTNPYKSFAIYRWLLGGFHHSEWSHVQLVLIPLMLAILFSQSLAKELDVLCLGDEIAQSLGINIKHLKVKCLFLLSVILGFVTSVAGAIPFVGLIAPHITRNLIGSHHKDLMQGTLINSMSLILLADLLAKKAFVHKELELGIILSLVGSPFFLYLILRKKNFANPS